MDNVENTLVGVEDVTRRLGISRSHAYKVVRALNRELAAGGCYILPGKVNKAYFAQKYFDIPETETGDGAEDERL